MPSDPVTPTFVSRAMVLRVLREHGVTVSEDGDKVTLVRRDGVPETYVWPDEVGSQTITRLARRYGYTHGFGETDFYNAARADLN